MSDSPTGAQVVMLTANDVRERIADGTAYVVDVREPHEHAEVRISGAHLVPLSNFDSSQISPADGLDLVLHCRSARRCGIAAEQLIAEGYSGTIYRMAGGILDWIAADFPVETG